MIELERYDEVKHGPLLSGKIEEVVYEITCIECPECGEDMTAVPAQQGWAPGSIKPEWILKEHFYCENTGCSRTWVEKPTRECPASQIHNLDSGDWLL